MKVKTWFISFGFLLLSGGCAMMQSIIKSTFPYTTTLVIPKSSPVGVELSVTGEATSFDQDFKKGGNNADKVSEVRMVSARIESRDPADFNIGNLVWTKIYMSKADSSGEVMVASRTDISPMVGNSMVLDIDNSNFLDEQAREPKVRIRMVYRLRNHINVNANLHIVLGLGAFPNRQ
ncbi:MAG TPA: hypothetical protein VIJ27_02225 [Mucilaginibacter sp.]